MSAAKRQIDRLLRPRSIALVGASATPGSLGENVLRNLENAGYSGDLHLVNPKRPMIHGRASLGSIDELPDGIDCAVLAIPAAAVLDAARACARKQVGSVIIFSAGFAESSASGRKAQQELAALAHEHNIVIEGPNCLGIVNYADSIPLTFVVTPPQPPSQSPGVAIISQSGALAAVVAVNMRHHAIHLTYSISTGNEAASGIEDFLEYLLDDPATRVIALIVEQFRQPQRFLRLTQRARLQHKHVVLLHPGSSSRARASAVTHTGAMAGDYDVMRTVVTRAGVVLVETLEELVDVSQILVRIRDLSREGAAIFCESGAFKAHALDVCERIGLSLPPLSSAAETALRAALPAFIPPSNPLDLTAQALVDLDLYRRTLPAVLFDEQFGSVILCIILTDPTTAALKLPPILDAIRTLQPAKPVIFAALDEGAPFNAPEIAELRHLGVPCFPSPERALRALARITAHRANQPSKIAPAQAHSPSEPALDTGVLAEYRGKQILQRLGIPVPPGALATTLDDAIRVAHTIGFPVALKAQSAALAHKSDAGGVILGIESEGELAAAWPALLANIQSSRPGLALEGVLVERMQPPGVELICGARNDPDWGPVLLAGFGGILAEAARDVRLLPPDLSVEEIVDELHSLRSAALLRGFRGSPPVNIVAAAQILSALGAFIQAHPEVAEIDLNPVVVYPGDKGAVALDAVIAVGNSSRDPQTQKEKQL
jgi:acetate---CoA ligase (ADP-forming)